MLKGKFSTFFLYAHSVNKSIVFTQVNNDNDVMKTIVQVSHKNTENTIRTGTGIARKSLENKSTSTVDGSTVIGGQNVTCNVVDNEKRLYTTSIYINSQGNADITRVMERQQQKSPVVSMHRINGTLDDEDAVERVATRNKSHRSNGPYETSATIYRHSHEPEKSYHSDSRVNCRSVSWVSCWQCRNIKIQITGYEFFQISSETYCKGNQSQTSM